MASFGKADHDFKKIYMASFTKKIIDLKKKKNIF